VRKQARCVTRRRGAGGANPRRKRTALEFASSIPPLPRAAAKRRGVAIRRTSVVQVASRGCPVLPTAAIGLPRAHRQYDAHVDTAIDDVYPYQSRFVTVVDQHEVAM
jgi:hypothetical protein